MALHDFCSGSVTLQGQFPAQANPAVAVAADRELSQVDVAVVTKVLGGVINEYYRAA